MLTEVSDVVACLVECPPVELEADDGEDDDGKEEEEGDVHLQMMIMKMPTTKAMKLMRMNYSPGAQLLWLWMTSPLEDLK